MSDQVIIALIIAATVLIVLFIFRKQLKDFIFNISKENGLKTEIHTHDPQSTTSAPGVRVSGTKMWGKRNRLDVRHTSADVSDTTLVGQDHQVTVATPDPRVAHLHQYIINNFSVNDLRTLSQNLHLHYDALPGTTLEAKAQALLEEAQQQQQLPALVAAGRALHPALPWED